jgi:hypothetical protein
MTIEAKLANLGLSLPTPPKPVAAYIPCVRTGNLVVVSGQLPMAAGQLLATGRVPSVVDLEQAKSVRGSACSTGWRFKSGARRRLVRPREGRPRRRVRASDDGFAEQPQVANGATFKSTFRRRRRHAEPPSA